MGHPSCFMDSVWCCRGEWLHCAVTQNTLSLHINLAQPLACLACLASAGWLFMCARRRKSLTHPLQSFSLRVCESATVPKCGSRGSVCPHALQTDGLFFSPLKRSVTVRGFWVFYSICVRAECSLSKNMSREKVLGCTRINLRHVVNSVHTAQV